MLYTVKLTNSLFRPSVFILLDAWAKRLGIAWFFISSLIRVCRSRWTVRIIHKISLIWFSHESYFEKDSHLKIFNQLTTFGIPKNNIYIWVGSSEFRHRSNQLTTFDCPFCAAWWMGKKYSKHLIFSL